MVHFAYFKRESQPYVSLANILLGNFVFSLPPDRINGVVSELYYKHVIVLCIYMKCIK